PSDWPIVTFWPTKANEPVVAVAPETDALRLIVLPALNVRRPAPETTGALMLMSPVALSTRLVSVSDATVSGALIDSVATGASESVWPRPLKRPENWLDDGRSAKLRFARLLPST